MFGRESRSVSRSTVPTLRLVVMANHKRDARRWLGRAEPPVRETCAEELKVLADARPDLAFIEARSDPWRRAPGA